MKKYEKKVVKKIYKLLKKNITQFDFAQLNMFDLSLFDTNYEHKVISSKYGEIQINFVRGIINAPLNIVLKGKYKRKIKKLVNKYYHKKRNDFAFEKLNKVENPQDEFSTFVNSNNLDDLFGKEKRN